MLLSQCDRRCFREAQLRTYPRSLSKYVWDSFFIDSMVETNSDIFASCRSVRTRTEKAAEETTAIIIIMILKSTKATPRALLFFPL